MSVQTIVFIPPLYVYIQIRDIVIKTEIKKGMFNESKNIICKTEATKNNLNEEPIILDSKKKKEPVL